MTLTSKHVDVPRNKGYSYCRLAWLAYSVLLFSLFQNVTMVMALKGHRGQAMWVWEFSNDIVQQIADQRITANLDDLIQFCHQHSIGKVYLSATKRNLNGPSPSIVIPQYYASWETIISTLHSQDIKVESLMGKADWLMPNNGFLVDCNQAQLTSPKEDRQYGLNVLEGVLQYQQQTALNNRFDAIHFDIEIQTLENFFDPEDCTPTSEKDRVQWYWEFIQQAKSARLDAGFDSSSLPFDWDISMLYDEPGHASTPHTHEGVEKPAWQHMFDSFERITFMTYQDRSRYIVQQLTAELAYLDQHPSAPLVWFSHEFQTTFRGLDLADVGLANEDIATMITLRQHVQAVMQDRPYFQGWALHCYDNEDHSGGQYPTWLESHLPYSVPKSIDFVASGDRKLIPTNSSEPIVNPVYVRLRIRAHHDYQYFGFSFQQMMSLFIIGRGYGKESHLEALRDISEDAYDGLAPVVWWYFGHTMWWTTAQGAFPTVQENGLCWANPATASDPHVGVERDLILEQDEPYRIILAYNAETIEGEFFTGTIQASSNQRRGTSFDDPIIVDLYLDQVPDYSIIGAPHLNHAILLYDTDGDGTPDEEEIWAGTNPYDDATRQPIESFVSSTAPAPPAPPTIHTTSPSPAASISPVSFVEVLKSSGFGYNQWHQYAWFSCCFGATILFL